MAGGPAIFFRRHCNLRAVKDAWRNPTMHVDFDYDREKALDVWNSVRGFLRRLSNRLRD